MLSAFRPGGLVCFVCRNERIRPGGLQWAYLFDTPVNDALTKDLLDWIRDSLHAEVIGFVPNHWHEDCMGGPELLQHTRNLCPK